MQNPAHDFIDNDESTMNSITSSSIMGFVDQVLNVKYGSYSPEKFDRLLDEFCQMVMELALGDKAKHAYFRNQTLLKNEIIEITQDRAHPELLSAVYFDSKANGGKGTDVTATYHTPQIFNLVLAAILDDKVYKELGVDTKPRQLLEDKKDRVRILFNSLFGEDHVGIAGRCNQGVRHELVGCLNGVYPKGSGEYWYFIEDMQAAIGLQISDYLAKIVIYNTDLMTIKLEPVLELSLKEFWELSEYALDGAKVPTFIQHIQSKINTRLILWAKEHFVNPSNAWEYSNIVITSISSTIMRHALKVPLFKAWDSLSTYAFSSYGTWLSVSSGKPAIDAVTNWIAEQTTDSLTNLKLTKDQIDHLTMLERLLTDGQKLDLLDIFGENLKAFDTRLDALLKATDSIERFWRVPSAEFNELTLDIHVAINKWFDTCSSESLLWRLIDLKQKPDVQVDLAHALAFFKRHCQRYAQGSTIEVFASDHNINLLVDILRDSRANDVLVLAIVNNNLPIVEYLTSSILDLGSRIVPPTHGLLSKKEYVRAIADTVIGLDDAGDLAGKVAVMLMQRVGKTVQDRAIIEKLITLRDKNGNNCLMTAISSANVELAVSIIKELSNEANWLGVMLTQQNNRNHNCLILALDRE